MAYALVSAYGLASHPRLPGYGAGAQQLRRDGGPAERSRGDCQLAVSQRRVLAAAAVSRMRSCSVIGVVGETADPGREDAWGACAGGDGARILRQATQTRPRPRRRPPPGQQPARRDPARLREVPCELCAEVHGVARAVSGSRHS